MTKFRQSKNAKLVILLSMALLTTGLLTVFLSRQQTAVSDAQDPQPFSIQIDAGSDHESLDHSGRLFLTDQEWTPQTRFGYIGGYRVWNPSKAHPTDGTADEFLHTNQRFNWEEYRFSSIPNGDYLATLTFSEIGVPYVTVFDVAIEGQIVLDDFRILDHVGGNYALTRRFSATVTDGELNVTAKPVVGDPRLAAIEVVSRSRDEVAPAIPTGLTTTSSYGAVLLDWVDNPEDDLDGYHVYRAASLDGPYTRLTVEPVRVSRYQDSVSIPHVRHYYCVRAVDAYGNESDRTPCQPGFALDKDDATLPLYELEVSAQDLVDLYSHALSDEEVHGVFSCENQAYPVTVRYRGGYGRYVHKKSWKINFPNGSPFPGRDQLNLRADYIDPTLMHTKLATELFTAAGVQLPEAEYVLFNLNGEYLGVYISNEQVDEGFLARTGQNADASIYKAVHTDTHDFTRSQPTKQAYHAAYEKKTNNKHDYGDIISFIELINNAPDEVFAHELTHVFDVAAYLDAYAITVLISNGDFVHHNAYLIHDLDTKRWTLALYDFDVTFQMVDRPINEGTAASPIQPREWNSVLLTRVLSVPQFHAYYCQRLNEFMNTVFSDASMSALIDETYAAIEQDGKRDWHKRHRESNNQFAAGPDEIKTYVEERRKFLSAEFATYCPVSGPFLSINEVMADNQTALEDPDNPGEFPPWFEIHNKGLEEADLSGMYLTNDLADPTRFRIADGVKIAAGGFITFLADSDSLQGPLHTNFRLDATGWQLGIFSGTQQIDAYSFGLPATDVSQGRHPDGADNWMPFNKPTPGRPNLLLPPIISGTTHLPPFPTSSRTVTVTTTITDDDTLLTATLFFSATGSGFIDVPMTRLPGNQYTAQVPPQPAGSLVQYYVLAADNDGRVSIDPAEPSWKLYAYIVDYQPPPLFINEFVANATQGMNAAQVLTDWIELHNAGPDLVDLGGLYLTDDLDNPTKYRIPSGTSIPGHGFLVFYADNEPERGARHTNFKLNRNGESVGLFEADIAGNQPVDVHTFGLQAPGASEGRCSDNDNEWGVLSAPTPGTANTPCDSGLLISAIAPDATAQRPGTLFINEFMAENGTTLEDPDEPGEFPDWIELYNADATPTDLGGKYLTDDLADPTKFRIPDGITIPSGGFIVFYADNDPEQGPLHTTFRLRRTGDHIGLFDVDTAGNQPIDTVVFGLQGVDLSERRYPDGAETWVMGHTPTPGTANAITKPPQ